MLRYYLVRNKETNRYNEYTSRVEAYLDAIDYPDCMECKEPLDKETRIVGIYPSLDVSVKSFYISTYCYECAPKAIERIKINREYEGIF